MLVSFRHGPELASSCILLTVVARSPRAGGEHESSRPGDVQRKAASNVQDGALLSEPRAASRPQIVGRVAMRGPVCGMLLEARAATVERVEIQAEGDGEIVGGIHRPRRVRPARCPHDLPRAVAGVLVLSLPIPIIAQVLFSLLGFSFCKS